ncbi:MAG TPA: DUF488 domain-containing protein [Thermoanaerobaculia bacterium]
MTAARSIWTVGHSNHPLEKFIGILKAHAIERVIDVRRFPVSRKWPHFDAESLAASLRAEGIDYAGMPALGGRRKARSDSPHTAWRTEAFRGYADFMDTPEFADSLGRAMALARERRSALLCAEALPWRCHRSILSDAFLARGWEVVEIVNEKDARLRKMPEFARVDGDRVIYDVGELFTAKP